MSTPAPKKAQIITDPSVLRQIYLNQPRVSLEEMRRSVLEGIHSAHAPKPLLKNEAKLDF